MYVVKCKKENEEFYLKITGFNDEFVKNASEAKKYKKEIAASVDVKLIKENNKNISCEIINTDVKYVKVFV